LRSEDRGLDDNRRTVLCHLVLFGPKSRLLKENPRRSRTAHGLEVRDLQILLGAAGSKSWRDVGHWDAGGGRRPGTTWPLKCSGWQSETAGRTARPAGVRIVVDGRAGRLVFGKTAGVAEPPTDAVRQQVGACPLLGAGRECWAICSRSPISDRKRRGRRSFRQ